jgi:hypothetical protein
MDGRTRTVGRAVLVVALALMVCLTAAAAAADVTTGRQAFERGDYQAAAAAWRPLAEQGSGDAEFGLGEVAEQGDGDYRRAAFWYEKAAAAGSIEARYRLALIALAGDRDTPADLTAAYKWAVLADDPNDPWGRLAAGLLAVLRQHVSPPTAAEGQRQADAWRQAHGGGKQRNPVAELNAALRGIDCAALHAAPVAAAPTAGPIPPASGLAGHGSSVASPLAPVGLTTAGPAEDGAVVISGTIPDAAARAGVIQIANRLIPGMRPELHVDVLPPPLCRSLAALDALRGAGLAAGDLKVQVNSGAAVLRQGDSIKIEVRAENYPVALRIDYFSLDHGQVLHLLPDGIGHPVILAAGADQTFGSSRSGTWQVGSAPYGTEFIAVVATPRPLDLDNRPEVEPAADYLPALAAALRRSGGQAGQPNLLAAVLVHTAGRP